MNSLRSLLLRATRLGSILNDRVSQLVRIHAEVVRLLRLDGLTVNNGVFQLLLRVLLPLASGPVDGLVLLDGPLWVAGERVAPDTLHLGQFGLILLNNCRFLLWVQVI